MASSTASDASPNAGCPSLKSWSRAPHFPHDYEARTDLPPLRPDAETTATSVAYLAHLRAAVAEHRDRINEELTGRMEEDKKREAAAAATAEGEEQKGAAAGQPAKGKNNKRKAAAADVDQEALEEENYGEEVVEED